MSSSRLNYCTVLAINCLCLLIYSYWTGQIGEEVKLKQHFLFELPVWEHQTSCSKMQRLKREREECQICNSKPELWDCVGKLRYQHFRW